jgi:hypothetical protein
MASVLPGLWHAQLVGDKVLHRVRTQMAARAERAAPRAPAFATDSPLLTFFLEEQSGSRA